MEFEELEQQREEGLKAAGQVAGKQNGMTLRERFRRTMHYQSVDRLPNFEFGYWESTLRNWHKQGLPESVVNEGTAYDFFGIENWYVAPVNVGINRIFCESKVIEETDEKIVTMDWNGGISEINKSGDKSIPHYIKFPITDRKSWEPFKESLLDDAGRYPDNWDELAAQYRNRDYPLGINLGSLIGVARNLIGFNGIALMVYEDPSLLEEIVDTFCTCVCRSIRRAVKDVQFDYAFGWEDICFNSGPIVGVPFFRDVLAPRYKRITDLMRLHGVDIAATDCDGNITQVVPHFLAGGVNTMFPVEVHGGTDPVALRLEHGRELRLWGGVDKMIFLQDKAAIDREMERLRPVVEDGGFIPTVDHRVQADASYDLYRHYLDRKRELFNIGGTPKY